LLFPSPFGYTTSQDHRASFVGVSISSWQPFSFVEKFGYTTSQDHRASQVDS
jgi:hypothetical protein